jgi:hypothetical protein
MVVTSVSDLPRRSQPRCRRSDSFSADQWSDGPCIAGSIHDPRRRVSFLANSQNDAPGSRNIAYATEALELMRLAA